MSNQKAILKALDNPNADMRKILAETQEKYKSELQVFQHPPFLFDCISFQFQLPTY